MDEEIKNLKPSPLWNFFYDLTRIPRPSKKEAGAAEYVKRFGEERGLEVETDKTGNVIISKPATPGMENLKGVVLQAHLDMVPQKNSNSSHNFETDPVRAYVDGEWVTADGTTLGADNGIGVAAALAVLDSDGLEHGPLEALFTVDEETGMTGAFGLKKGFVRGDILLNMDSEEEGELYVGCAGGMDANIEFRYNEVEAERETTAFTVRVGGLKGGHSGLDIDLGRGNANKLLFRFLKFSEKNHGLRIAAVDGGGLRNAIPREAQALVTVAANRQNDLKNSVEEYEKIYRSELSGVEPDLSFTVEEAEQPGGLIDIKTRKNLINSIVACPNGVIRMSSSMPGLVETSTNLANVKSENGKITIQCLMRSSVDTSREDIAGMIESVFTLAGAGVSFDGAYPGWKPDMNSEILGTMQNVYKALYGKTPEIKALHAGLECGLIGGVYPGLDMISFGPTIKYPHSPDEKVHIESVGKFWAFLVEILKKIPVR